MNHFLMNFDIYLVINIRVDMNNNDIQDKNIVIKNK